ncbi:hypothetical protein O0L34_g4089 [Tuta absoluta]|nr:hypothetical protein O0L34_g4089 [Tuta absoluta]
MQISVCRWVFYGPHASFSQHPSQCKSSCSGNAPPPAAMAALANTRMAPAESNVVFKMVASQFRVTPEALCLRRVIMTTVTNGGVAALQRRTTDAIDFALNLLSAMLRYLRNYSAT